MTRASLCHAMNHINLLALFRSIHRRCCLKNGVLKYFENFIGKHLCWSFFLIIAGIQACSFYYKDTLTLMFSYGNCKILKNTYFEEHLQKTASICFTSKYYNKYWWQVWTPWCSGYHYCTTSFYKV